jgi:hypothetical protein
MVTPSSAPSVNLNLNKEVAKYFPLTLQLLKANKPLYLRIYREFQLLV